MDEHPEDIGFSTRDPHREWCRNRRVMCKLLANDPVRRVSPAVRGSSAIRETAVRERLPAPLHRVQAREARERRAVRRRLT